MSVNLGTGASRPNISADDKQLLGVIWQEGMPPLDSELNLMSLIDIEARAKEIRSRVASGWLFDELNPEKYFKTDPSYSNFFEFGLPDQPVYAVVNGWVIPVAFTGQTGTNPSHYNKIVCPIPESSASSGTREDLIYLEVWLKAVSSSTGLNGSELFKYGNTLCGSNGLPNELVDPNIGFETTRRIQVQYAIRYWQNATVNESYPDGFYNVIAQGPSSGLTTTFAKHAQDPGLYVAEDVNFGTVDNCVYAIPLAVTFRRNSGAFNETSNIAGAYNRAKWANNSTQRPIQTLLPIVFPAINATVGTATLSVSAVTGTFLDPQFSSISALTPAYLKLDNEIIKVTSISGSNPYTVNFDRAQFGTISESHAANTTAYVYSTRPDGLFSDQITSTDLLDMRHSVADKFNYSSILRSNLINLLRSNLRSRHKDNVTQSGTVILNAQTFSHSSGLQAVDGVRTTWSDAAVLQKIVVPLNQPAQNVSTNANILDTNHSTYNVTVQITPVSSRTGSGFFAGDKIIISKIANANFLNDQDEALGSNNIKHSVIMHYDGSPTDPEGGSSNYTGTNFTIAPNTTNGVYTHGNGFTLTINPTTKNAEITIVNVANPASTSAKMWLEFVVVYDPGLGLAQKPDYFHKVNLTSSSTALMPFPLDSSLPVPLSETGLTQFGFQKTLAKNAPYGVDLGSKTVYASPTRYKTLPQLLVKSAENLNFRVSGTGWATQGIMPNLDVNGLPLSSSSLVNPASLWFQTDSKLGQFVEVPVDLLPNVGLQYTTIVKGSSTFRDGINFLLSSNIVTSPASNTNNSTVVSYKYGSDDWRIISSYDTPSGKPFGGSSANKIWGRKVSIPELVDEEGDGFDGIEFPRFVGAANISAVYSFNFTAGTESTSTNLLKFGATGNFILMRSDSNGDVSFVLNRKALNVTKSDFLNSSNNYSIVCSLFGYDRGFLQTNGRIAVLKDAAQTTDSLLTHELGMILNTPMLLSESLTSYYSSVVYQGDGGRNSPANFSPTSGSQSYGTMVATQGVSLSPPNLLSLNNPKGFEILDAISFSTSMGTGRLSGPTVLPKLLNYSQLGMLPEVAGSRLEVKRLHGLNNVGYSDWFNEDDQTQDKWPVQWTNGKSITIGTSALSDVYDHDIPAEFAGCTVQLPLGAQFRDKDFVGKTLYQARTSINTALMPVGTLTFNEFETSQVNSLGGKSRWEGRDAPQPKANSIAGVGTDKIVFVDAESPNSSSAALLFRTYRGGAAYTASNSFNGGILTAKFPKTRPNSNVGSVLNGVAYLAKDTNGELKMIIATQASPSYFRDCELNHSVNGMGLGYTAVDVYRLAGHPLEKCKAVVDTSVKPGPKPLFVNRVYDNPTFFGSADAPMLAAYQESADGSAFTNGITKSLSNRPVAPETVQMFLNGVKLRYGNDYSVGGDLGNVVTYLGTPTLLSTDQIEFWYVAY